MVFVASVFKWEALVKLLAQNLCQAFQQRENTHRFPTTFLSLNKKSPESKMTTLKSGGMVLDNRQHGLDNAFIRGI